VQNFAARRRASDTSARGIRILRGWMLGAVFLGAWAGISFVAGRLLPFPNVPDAGEKFHWFAARKDEFDTIFVGSSRMYYQIVPKQFDADTAAAGARTHSFNLALAGMWPPESFYFLRQILRLRPAHLKWVLIDLIDVNSRTELDTRRAVYWRDWMHTVMAVRDVAESPLPFGKKSARLWDHGTLFLKRWANPGSAGECLNEWMIPSHLAAPKWADANGFEPLVERRLTGARLQRYLGVVASFKAGPPREPARAVYFDACREIAAEVRRAGAEPVFILAPTSGTNENRFELPEGIPVLDFNDPAQYPLLFGADLRYDEWHLNEIGAIAYTRLVAQHFVVCQRRLSRN
jgi:hypothetical protein